MTREIIKNLNAPFSGYHSNDSDAIDEELTRVGRETPCGEYMRRFWQPVALSAEATQTPLAIRILGEDLVVFRDGRGRVGVLERRCCHRGASLEFGRVSEQGIKCCYHGWHFDVDGTILDTPAEAPSSRIKGNLFQGAYPTRESNGLIFAYMGPPDRTPAFPEYDCYAREGVSYKAYKLHSPCNWLQIRENDLDTAHAKYLHTDLFDVQVTEVYSAEPIYDWRETPIGILSVSTRRWKENVFVRATDFILPNLGRFTAIEDAEGSTYFDQRAGTNSWCVPVDDTNSLTFNILEIETALPDPERNAYIDRQVREGKQYQIFEEGQDGSRPYSERQKAPGDWDAWVSQGPISLRDRDHLAGSDRGVSMLRRMLRAGIRDVAAGRDPKGVFRELSEPVPTYAHSTVERLAKGATDNEDMQLCKAFGDRAVDDVVNGVVHQKKRPA